MHRVGTHSYSLIPTVDALQQAHMPVVEPTECDNNEVICAGNGWRNTLDDACLGNSGGPLMCRNTDGSWTVKGVASYVMEYCDYTAYAPTGDLIDWINLNVAKE